MQSGEGGIRESQSPLYLGLAAFARMWGWSDTVYLSMPVRRRTLLLPILEEQIKTAPKLF